MSSTTTFAFAALALGLASCAEAADASSQNHPLLGKLAPELTAEVVGGEGPKDLKSARGTVLIVDFWGTYCEPCRRLFPKYQALVDQFQGSLAVIGVSVDEPESVTKDQITQFAKDNHAKFSIVWDKDRSAVAAYGMRDMPVPTSFVIDKAGNVRYVYAGFHEPAEILGELKALVK